MNPTEPHQPTPDDRVLFGEFDDLRNSPEMIEVLSALTERTGLDRRALELKLEWPDLSCPDVESQVMKLRWTLREASLLAIDYVRSSVRLSKAYSTLSDSLQKLVNDK